MGGPQGNGTGPEGNGTGTEDNGTGMVTEGWGAGTECSGTGPQDGDRHPIPVQSLPGPGPADVVFWAQASPGPAWQAEPAQG